MAVRDIIRMGHPTLRTPARPLTDAEITSPDTRRLVDDMIDTLHHAGGIGLAAPQIDVPVRLAIIEIDPEASRYGDIPPMPLTVFVNPRIEVVDEASAGFWEGCLSVPGLRGWVERPQHVRVSARNLAGEPLELELRGFLATVFQHEFDHLDGRLYIDRMTDPTRLMFEEEFEQFVLHGSG
ncbi:MAG: peptide deformylase [Gammaproteobacteria bacterium]|jgi:peptide deformylase|nr:peptide deformylase [Gammaproteobacteria bacterium]MBK80673.1 peptide deformylase [Gammaproteobacteria bacterium]|tara:strand:- start:6794 stop:7336 length:543 start_codon:yes stop_codon:yes gene_type:complete